MKNPPYYYETYGMIFVHAGIDETIKKYYNATEMGLLPVLSFL